MTLISMNIGTHWLQKNFHINLEYISKSFKSFFYSKYWIVNKFQWFRYIRLSESCFNKIIWPHQPKLNLFTLYHVNIHVYGLIVNMVNQYYFYVNDTNFETQYTLSLILADPASWTFEAYNNDFSIVALDILFYDVKILREPVWYPVMADK